MKYATLFSVSMAANGNGVSDGWIKQQMDGLDGWMKRECFERLLALKICSESTSKSVLLIYR